MTSQNMLLFTVYFVHGRATTRKAHITNNNIIIVFAYFRTVFSEIILLSKVLTTRSTQGNVMPGSNCAFYSCSTRRKHKLSLLRIPTVAVSYSDHTRSLKQNARAEWLRLVLRTRELMPKLQKRIDANNVYICAVKRSAKSKSKSSAAPAIPKAPLSACGPEKLKAAVVSSRLQVKGLEDRLQQPQKKIQHHGIGVSEALEKDILTITGGQSLEHHT